MLLLCMLITTNEFAQTKKFNDKYDEFDYYAKPSETSVLANYFKNKLTNNLVEAANFKDSIGSHQRIFLTFRFNQENKMVMVKAHSAYTELNTEIEEAFKKFDINQLSIPEKSTLNNYALQIISRENNKNSISCNTVVVYDRYPVFEGCDSINNYGKMKSCINKQLEAHIVKNISPQAIKKAKLLGRLKLYPKFIINEEGGIENIVCKAPTDSLSAEFKQLIALFPKAKKAATRNGQPTKFAYYGSIGLQIDSDDKKYEEAVLQSNDSILNPNNELALHFKNEINEDALQRFYFSKNGKALYIYFGINKKGKLIDVKSNSMNKDDNKRIVDIFKKFPVEKLNITNPNKLDSYRFTIITKGHKNVIECNDKPDVFNYPLFDKSCGKSDSALEVRTCLNESIAYLIISEFNTKLNSKTTLTGEIRIVTRFEINTLGEFVNIKVTAPNPYLENELIRIIKDEFPKVYKPAYRNGKPDLSRWTIPVVFVVRDNKPEDPFKELKKKF